MERFLLQEIVEIEVAEEERLIKLKSTDYEKKIIHHDSDQYFNAGSLYQTRVR